MKKFYLLLAALIGFTFSANASTRMLYRQNFETATGVPADWKAPTNQSWLTLSSDDFGKFLNFAPNGNDRSCYLFWGGDIIKAANTSTYTVAFDFNAKAWGNNHSSSDITVGSAETENTYTKTVLNANYRSKSTDWLFDLTQVAVKSGDDYTIGHAPAASGDQTFAINGDSTNTVELTAGTWYTVTLNIDTVARTVDYAITTQVNPDAPINQGTYTIPDSVNAVASGINFLGARYYPVQQFDNIVVSCQTDYDYANAPSATLTGINNHQRVYQLGFIEGETLHYTFNGGEEQTVSYDDCDGNYAWSNNPNYDPNNEGLVEDPCESGELVAWTTSGDATSDKVTTEVSNDIISLPGVTTAITNVEYGYGKTYTITADNADVPLRPTLFISYTFTPAEGGETQSQEDLSSGAQITIPSEGTIEFTTSAFGYGSTNSTVENNTPYKQSAEINLAHLDEASITAAGFKADDNVNNNFSNYGRYFGYSSADSSKIVYNTIPQYTKKASEWTDSVIVGNLAFKAIPGVSVHIYKGLGLVTEGRKGDNKDGNWIQTATFTVNGLQPTDIVMFSKTGNYGGSSLHPVVADLDEFLAGDVAPVDAVMNAADVQNKGYGITRISDCLHKISIMSEDSTKKDSTETGIKNVNITETEAVKNAPIYTITGVRVRSLNDAPAGIYIQDRKKFIKK